MGRGFPFVAKTHLPGALRDVFSHLDYDHPDHGSLTHFCRTNDPGATPRIKPIGTLELRVIGALPRQIVQWDGGSRDIRHN